MSPGAHGQQWPRARRRNAAVSVALASVIVAALLVAPGMVSARHVHVDDPRDTKGPLDVRRVATGGGMKRPIWRIITYSRWNPRGIFERGYFLVHLDMRGDNAFEHYVLVHSNGSRMRARLFRERENKPPRNLGPVRVWRKNKRSVSLRLGIGDLVGGRREHYRWKANSLFTSNKCPRVCIDRIPDKGAVIEEWRRPEAIPEPEPTPSP